MNRADAVLQRAWNSYPVLDLLLVLYSVPGKGWSAVELVARMGLHENSVRRMLMAAQVRGLVTQGSGPLSGDRGRPPDLFWPAHTSPFHHGFKPSAELIECSTLTTKGAAL